MIIIDTKKSLEFVVMRAGGGSSGGGVNVNVPFLGSCSCGG